MVEINASVKLLKYLYDEKINLDVIFLYFIGHKENKSVYGALFKTEKGLLFQRHKWIEINKNKSVPKFCSQIDYVHKIVNETIYNSFEIISNEEYCNRDFEDMQII